MPEISAPIVQIEPPAPNAATSAESTEQRRPPARIAFEPTLLQHEQEFFAAAEREPEQVGEKETHLEQPAPRAPTDTIVDTQNFDAHSDTIPGARQRQASRDELKVPTRGVPKWAVATVVVVALAGSGLVLSLTLSSESENKSESPKASASVSKKPAPSASVAPASSLARRPPKASVQPSSLGAPPPPPPLPVAEPVPSPPAPVQRTAPRSQEPVSPPLHPSKAQNAPQVQHREPAPAPVAESTPKKPSVEPAPKSPSVVTPPEVAKTLSPLDRIIAEIRLISPDPVGIEDKARELARIIARSKRKEAGQIVDKLGPPIAVDPLSRDATLEESLQTFAISVLGRVATDDDDNRAVDALLMLGEWVSNGGKGKQKALSALQTLSHEQVIKTSAPRLRALKTAQAQAD